MILIYKVGRCASRSHIDTRLFQLRDVVWRAKWPCLQRLRVGNGVNSRSFIVVKTAILESKCLSVLFLDVQQPLKWKFQVFTFS